MTDTGASWVSRGEAKRGVANDGVPTLLTDNTLTSITAAPVSGQRLMIDELFISSDAAGYVMFKCETGGALVTNRVYFPGAGTIQLTPRCGFLVQTANKKLQAQLSGTFNVSVLAHYRSVPGTTS